jgi:DNA (cytosine-5)-methyltransferase 1
MVSYVDLFCGAGGFSVGLDQAGFENIFSIEYDSSIAQTYRFNFPSHNLIQADISKVTDEQLIDASCGIPIDVVVGGPPCQGFSMAGSPGRTFVDDPRNYLFKEFVRVIHVLKPKVFIFENVAKIATHRKGNTVREIASSFHAEGYKIVSSILNASDYGVPQDRRRFIMVGVRSDIDRIFSFPPVEEKKVTVSQAIGDLPPLKSGESSEIPNHNAMKHSEQMLLKMSFVSDGGDRSEIPEDLRPISGDARKYIRYASDKPSVCVTGDMRKIFHYNQNRALTSRELARLQTFPDDFIFKGDSIGVQQQIGNAVPPLLAKKLALQVKEVLNE